MSQSFSIDAIELFVDEPKSQVFCTSRQIAEKFDKEHKNVLRDIANLVMLEGEVEPTHEEVGRLIFEPSTYLNEQNKSQPEYRMSMTAFILLAKGFDVKEVAV